MTAEPRPEVVQALTSALMGMDASSLDDLTNVTADERTAAHALVAALLAVGGDPADRKIKALGYLAEQGLADTPLSTIARDHADAWLDYQRILLVVDELD